MKIRSKIIFSVIPLVVLPPLIVALVSYLWIKQIAAHTKSFDASAQNISTSVSHAVSNINTLFNDRIQRDYEFIAENTANTIRLINTFIEREIHQLAFSSALESYMTVTGSGRDFIAPKIYGQLHEAAMRSGFLSISLLDTDGKSLLDYPINVSLPSDLKMPENNKTWQVYHVLSKQEPPSLLYLAPLRYDGLRASRDKGKLAGWLAVDLPFSNFTDQLTPFHNKDSMHMALLDGEGNLLYEPRGDAHDHDNLNNTLSFHFPIIQDILQIQFLIPWQEVYDATRSTTELLEDLDRETIYAREISKQADRFAVQASIPLSLTLLGVVFIATLLGRGLAQAFTKPITKLSEVAGQLAAGDLSVNPRLEGNDEVVELSNSLDRMRLSLRDHISNLDRLVAAKTNDLNAKTKALAVSERESRELITRMNDAFVLLEVLPDTPAKIVFTNPAFNLLANESNNPQRPVPFLDDAEYDRCLNVAYTGVADRFDIHTSDERYFSYNIYSPSPNRLAVVISNLTQRYQAEAESRRLEEAMRSTQKLESLGVLAGGIAHDFNNLLMAIMGNADLALLEAPSGSPLQENLAEIQKSSLRAANLCKQMLAYSGQGQFVIEECNLSELINDMTQLLGVSIADNVQIAYHFDPDLPHVEADTTQMRQIVLNLVTNASEAMKGTDGHIYIRTKTEELPHISISDNPAGIELPAGRYSTVEVEDNGVGMSTDALSRIFEPFFTTKMTGRGLGMSAVLGIVRSHKGLIRIKSKEGAGTTVSVSIPALAVSMNAKDPDATVLLMDNEPEMAAVLERMLQKSNIRVTRMDDPQAAYDAYTANPNKFSFVIASQGATLQNNITLIRALLTFDSRAKVIMVGRHSEADAMNAFRDVHVLGYIQKPYQLSRVRAICQRFNMAK